MSDPKRLLSSAPRGGVERLLLESALDAGPTNAQCDALWEGLAARLVAVATLGVGAGAINVTSAKAGAAALKGATASATAAKSLALGVLVKGAVVLGVVGSVGGAAFIATRHADAPAAPAPASVSAPSSPVESRPVEPRPVQALPIEARPTEATSHPEPSHARALPPAREPSPGSKARPSPSSSVRARDREPAAALPTTPDPTRDVDLDRSVRLESATVRDARQRLRSGDCAGALGQLTALDARVPSGELAQERHVLTIDALTCEGRTEAATQRAASFVRAYPSSPYTESLRRRLLR